MVKVKAGETFYEYPDKKGLLVLLDKNIKIDMDNVCKARNINKSKLIESFYKAILLRLRTGNLEATNGYISFNFNDPALKKKKV